ncbi:MAG: ABC transporter permease [Nocardioides sp.]
MLGYIIRRLVSALLVLILASFITFALFFEGPVNQARVICDSNSRCTPERLESIENAMGLNDGLWVNYTRFLGGLVQDREISYGPTYQCDAPCLGISFHTRTEVTDDLKRYYPATLSLAIGGAILYLLIGIPIGILAARFRGTFLDKFTVGASLIIASIPYYVLALAAWILLTLKTGIFPETGYNPITENPGLWFSGLLLPWVILGITGAPTYTRYTRGQMLEAMGEDYIRTAKAKGLGSQTVLYKHAFRAALVPIVTIFGLDFATLLSGTIFTEAIFGIDGIGRWTIESLRPPTDFPIVNATVLIFAVFVILGNLIVDLLYAVLDPRVRLV